MNEKKSFIERGEEGTHYIDTSAMVLSEKEVNSKTERKIKETTAAVVYWRELSNSECRE